MDYIKLFNQHSEYESYINSENKKLPNLSYCEDNDCVHFNPWVDPRLIITFNVTDTTTPIKIMANANVIETFSEIEIDGVVQPSVVNTYTFDTTGLHIIKYTLVDPTFIGHETISLFYNCPNIISVKISNTAIIISSAFAQCENLTSVTIPNSVTTIGNLSFNSCYSLLNITIPNSVTTIGNSAFEYCTHLTSITINTIIPPSLGNHVFDDTNCPIYVPSASVEAYKTASGWSTYAYRIQAIQ